MSFRYVSSFIFIFSIVDAVGAQESNGLRRIFDGLLGRSSPQPTSLPGLPPAQSPESKGPSCERGLVALGGSSAHGASSDKSSSTNSSQADLDPLSTALDSLKLNPSPKPLSVFSGASNQTGVKISEGVSVEPPTLPMWRMLLWAPVSEWTQLMATNSGHSSTDGVSIPNSMRAIVGSARMADLASAVNSVFPSKVYSENAQTIASARRPGDKATKAVVLLTSLPDGPSVKLETISDQVAGSFALVVGQNDLHVATILSRAGIAYLSKSGSIDFLAFILNSRGLAFEVLHPLSFVEGDEADSTSASSLTIVGRVMDQFRKDGMAARDLYRDTQRILERARQVHRPSDYSLETSKTRLVSLNNAEGAIFWRTILSHHFAPQLLAGERSLGPVEMRERTIDLAKFVSSEGYPKEGVDLLKWSILRSPSVDALVKDLERFEAAGPETPNSTLASNETLLDYFAAYNYPSLAEDLIDDVFTRLSLGQNLANVYRLFETVADSNLSSQFKHEFYRAFVSKVFRPRLNQALTSATDSPLSTLDPQFLNIWARLQSLYSKVDQTSTDRDGKHFWYQVQTDLRQHILNKPRILDLEPIESLLSVSPPSESSPQEPTLQRRSELAEWLRTQFLPE